MHSLEHLIATYLRNGELNDQVVYWGPMGCLTGFYLILKGNRKPKEIYGLILSAFQSVKNAKTVPGTKPENCGHYLMHDLKMAKFYANEFAEYLIKNKNNPAIFEYPKTKRLLTKDGKHFFDS